MEKFKKIQPKNLNKKIRSFSACRSNKSKSNILISLKKPPKNSLLENLNIFNNFNSMKNHKKTKSFSQKTNSININNKISRNNSFASTKSNSNIENKENFKRFSNLILDSKKILNSQNKILFSCDEISKKIIKNEIQIELNKINNNEIIELIDEIKKKNFCENCEKNKIFFIENLNKINGFIGEKKYKYIFHKFKDYNFNNENILIYFENLKNLINNLDKQNQNYKNIINTQNEKIIHYEQVIKEYQKQIQILNNNFNNDNNNFNNDNNNFNNDNNNFNNENVNLSNSSSLFDSNSFFENYKRNKELYNNYENIYTDCNNK